MINATVLSRAGRAWPRLRPWIVRCTSFAGVQIVVQLLSVASGILLVRTLDKQHYAWFTIIGTMQGTLSLLADNGIGMALMAEGGKVYRDPVALGRLINSALPLRRILGTASAVVVVPVIAWMLLKSGAPVSSTVALILTLLFGFYFSLTSGALQVVPRLLSQVSRLQNYDLIAAGGRLAFLLLLAAAALLNVFSATFIAALFIVIQYLCLRRWVRQDADLSTPPSAADRRSILSVVRRVTPNTLFYCVQGQLGIWLIATFGNADKVADIGALGRLALLFSVVGTVIGSLLAPVFARSDGRRKLLQIYLLVLGGLILVCIPIVGFSILFPAQLLWLLGKGYEHLHEEVALTVGYSVSGAIAATMWAMNAARAWIDLAWAEIPLRVLLQVALLALFDIGTVRGVLLFSIFSSMSPIAVNCLLTIRGFQRLHVSA